MLVTPALGDTSANITDDKEQHTADDYRDQERIEETGIKNQWAVGRAGRVVAKPGGRKLDRRRRMAALAGREDVLANAFRIVHSKDGVRVVAVYANRLVRSLSGGN
jgi:hypothetical protein